MSGLDERTHIFLDVHKNEAPTLVVPCRSESAGMLPGAEAYQIQPIDIVYQVDQSFRVGRILDAQGKNVVGICWKEDEPKALNPVIWPGSLKDAKVIDAVKANEVRGGAVIGDSMFITTALAGKATTMAFTADAQVDVETSGLTINSIVCKSAGGFVGKGSMNGLTGYWLVTGK